MRLLFFAGVLAFVLSSCDDQRVYEYSQDLTERVWRVNDTLRFDFAIKDPGKRYNIYYNVRNSLDYPYARLFLQYTLRDSSGAEYQKKLVSDFLFDQKSGEPRGTSGLGDVFDHRFQLLQDFEFKRPGTYTVKLEQFMRMDTLPGILSMGVRVETAEEKEVKKGK